MRLRGLIGSGDRIVLFTLPFLLAGLALEDAFPSAFHVGGPPQALRGASIAFLAVGVATWAWSVGLILTRARRGELITGGPYALVKHPIYAAIALLVLPWLGFLLDSWLGLVLGAALYAGSRLFAPAEEAELAGRFGPAWDDYSRRVRLPRL